jgi:nuclear pore complex protein Nup155
LTLDTADQVTQLVSDIERGCFYALSEAGVISVYKTNGEKAIQLVQRLANIFQSAQDKAPGNPAIHPSNFKLYGLQVVRSSESRNGISLVAITSSGVRLYFAFAAAGYAYSYGSSSGSNGRTLQLVHLRLPPTKLLHPDDQARANPAGPAGMNGASASSGPFPLSDLDNVCYDLGVTLATQPGDSETRDFLLCLSPDITRVGTLGQVEKPPAEPPLYANGAAGPQKPPLAEYASLLAIPGRTWAMAAVRHSASTPASAFQELATQFSEPSRQFMILTSAGITFLAKRRPLDYLKDVIEEYHAEGTVQSILHFRDRWVACMTFHWLLGSYVQMQLRPGPDVRDAAGARMR